MANLNDVKSKEVKITLNDGVERVVKFDLNAMAELEDKYGSVDAAFKALDEGSIKAVRFVLWAGLIHEDASLTERQVGSLIDMNYMSNLMNTLGQSFGADMPTQDSELDQNVNADQSVGMSPNE